MFSPVAWKSRKINREVKSALAAEILALEQGLEAYFMIKSFICEIMSRQVSEEFFPIKCYTDNKSLIDSIYFTKTVTQKRLQIDICIVREMIAKKEVTSVEWCKSESQLTDSLTKGWQIA